MVEVFQHATVPPDALLTAKAADIYAAFMDTPPPPKVVVRRPELPWAIIWQRLWRPPLALEAANISFQLLHNILPVRARLARWGQPAAATCPLCPGVIEDTLHVFVRCPRIAALWEQLLAALVVHTGPVADEELLLLAWPPTARDGDLAVALRSYHHLVWASRSEDWPPSFRRLTAGLRALPAPYMPLW